MSAQVTFIRTVFCLNAKLGNDDSLRFPFTKWFHTCGFKVKSLKRTGPNKPGSELKYPVYGSVGHLDLDRSPSLLVARVSTVPLLISHGNLRVRGPPNSRLPQTSVSSYAKGQKVAK
jgi:hypothetical protein